MSKVKIQGNSSGTGVLTVTAPNTSTDRTITLPDSTGTLLTTDGDGSSLTGVGVDGISSSADATAITIDSSEKVNFNQGRLQLGHINKFIDTANYVGDCINVGYHPYAAGIILGASYPADNPTTIVKGIELNNTDIKFYTNSSTSTATKQLEIKSDGRGLSQFTAKAWVNFNGTGTVAIRDSHNVSSVTDNGAGDYSIMFDVNLANVNFAGAGLSAADGYFVSYRNGTAWNAAGYARVCHQNSSGTKTDGDTITFIFFGD